MGKPRLLDLLAGPDGEGIKARFWAKVDRAGGCAECCWEWQAAKHPTGYGAFVIRKPWNINAHRFSYQLAYGQVDDALVVCHHCDNPGCVRPDHLFVGTHGDNVRDKIAKGRQPVGAALNHPSQKGEGNHAARLTETQAEEILRRYRAGEKRKDIAEVFGLDYRTVWAIGTGRRWGHLQ